MAHSETPHYTIDFHAILQVGDPRKQAILARKALAGFWGLRTTAPLKNNYRIKTNEDAVAGVASMIERGIGIGLPVGYEPSDHTDKSSQPVSLEAAMQELLKDKARLVSEVADEAKALIASGLLGDALQRVLEEIDAAPKEIRGPLVEVLETLAKSVPYALACLGQIYLIGDGVKRDPDRGIKLLKDAIDSPDAEAGSSAALWLGEHYSNEHDYKAALKAYETGTRLGSDICAFNIGLWFEQGRPGIARDIERSASYYRMAVEFGHRDAKTNLALLLARKEVEPRAGEDWRMLLNSAAAADDHIAAGCLKLIARFEREIGKDRPDELAKRLRDGKRQADSLAGRTTVFDNEIA